MAGKVSSAQVHGVPSDWEGLKGGRKGLSLMDTVQALRQSKDIDSLVQHLFFVFLKAAVVIHDLIIVPVHVYKKEKGPFGTLAEDLIKACSYENIRSGQFAAEDLTQVFLLQQSFFQDVVKKFVVKAEGEESSNYREKVWETIAPSEFVDTYLLSNPNNFTIFRDIILKGYLA